MSIKVMTDVWEHAPFVGTDLLILLALADMANDDRECWPGLKHVAHKGRITTRQVQSVLSNLEMQGVIEIIHRTVPERGNVSNLYRIKPASSWDILVAYDEDNPPDAQHTPLTLHASPPSNGATGKSVKEPSLETKLETGERSRATPPIHPLIQTWASIRGIDCVNIGAPVFTSKDLTLARKMAKWEQPPTEDEIRKAITTSKAKDYPFSWLEADIPKVRLVGLPSKEKETNPAHKLFSKPVPPPAKLSAADIAAIKAEVKTQ